LAWWLVQRMASCFKARVTVVWAPLSEMPVGGDAKAIGICCGRIGYWHRIGRNEYQE